MSRHFEGQGDEKHLGVSKNRGKTPQIIRFNRVFHYFHHPFWGFSPYFWKLPFSQNTFGFDIPTVANFLGDKIPHPDGSLARSIRCRLEFHPDDVPVHGAKGFGLNGILAWQFFVTFFGWLSDPFKG